ncbi:MAG: three-Cys-motif partner protein TcmP [Chloroflexi bacterium]|nr:three-Cys-motif partner protein TcmP [Chloroflexota bacterium]
MAFQAPSIETDDDNLPMRDGGVWTYAKLHYLNQYLCRFIVSMRKKNWRAIHYIDLFAGLGRNRLDNRKVIHGSPVLALLQPRTFDHYFFGESDPDALDVLKQRCSVFREQTDAISYLPGDANETVNEVCQYINERDRVYIPNVGQSLNLAFLDPEGLELSWDTVAKLAVYRTDMIIYYPQMGITRDADTNPQAIDHFFGDSDWREIYDQHKGLEIQPLHRALLDHYKQNLQKYGYIVEDPIPEPLFTNLKNAPLYRLLFVSKHPLGNKFWEDVNKRLPTGQMRLF